MPHSLRPAAPGPAGRGAGGLKEYLARRKALLFYVQVSVTDLEQEQFWASVDPVHTAAIQKRPWVLESATPWHTERRCWLTPTGPALGTVPAGQFAVWVALALVPHEKTHVNSNSRM